MLGAVTSQSRIDGVTRALTSEANPCWDLPFQLGHKKIGSGSSKEVYIAIDHERGIEVAWNEFKLRVVRCDPTMRGIVHFQAETTDMKQLSKEMQYLRDLRHPNIIVFYDAWVDVEGMRVVMITELMRSGSIKAYIKKATPGFKLRVVKIWCRQILEALDYLHSHDPPIIHRDIKCDNIFIDGASGTVKIGDLGLVTKYKKGIRTSLVGTPEFMAPEIWRGEYDEKADIWAFGMCVLEMVTLAYPYAECNGRGHVIKQITRGILPCSIQRVQDPEVTNFILLTLELDPARRLSARQFLNCPFLQDIENECNKRFVELLPQEQYDELLDKLGFSRKRSQSTPDEPTTRMTQQSDDLACRHMAELAALAQRHAQERTALLLRHEEERKAIGGGKVERN